MISRVTAFKAELSEPQFRDLRFATISQYPVELRYNADAHGSDEDGGNGQSSCGQWVIASRTPFLVDPAKVSAAVFQFASPAVPPSTSTLTQEQLPAAGCVVPVSTFTSGM